MENGKEAELVVRGEGGLFEGERRKLKPGDTLVVGRSRSCHVSLRRTPRFMRHPEQRKLLHSRPFLRVSRVHCEIAYLMDGQIEIRDLSANGTMVDGDRIQRLVRLPAGGDEICLQLCDPRHGKLIIENPARLPVAASAR